jgi:hypothetical protein
MMAVTRSRSVGLNSGVSREYGVSCTVFNFYHEVGARTRAPFCATALLGWSFLCCCCYLQNPVCLGRLWIEKANRKQVQRLMVRRRGIG